MLKSYLNLASKARFNQESNADFDRYYRDRWIKLNISNRQLETLKGLD